MPVDKNPKEDQDTRGNMAAITVIANPLLQDKKVVLFQSGSPTYGLRVSSRELASEIFPETFGPEDPKSVGRRVAYPGQLVSVLYKDFVTVYGITGDTVDELQVEMLSPVQCPLDLGDVSPLTGALAACATGNGQKGWLYLMTKDDDNKPVIGEWELSSDAPTLRYIVPGGFSLSSSLCAVFDKGNTTRWLIYQNTDNALIIRNAVSKKEFPIPLTSGRAVEKTPITASIIPEATPVAPFNYRMAVYFVGKETGENQLYCAVCKISADNIQFETNWGQPRAVKDPTDGTISLQSWAGLSSYVDFVPAQERARVLVYCLRTKPKKEAKFDLFKHEFSEIQK